MMRRVGIEGIIKGMVVVHSLQTIFILFILSSISPQVISPLHPATYDLLLFSFSQHVHIKSF
jgi:hypothetical protein